MENGQWWAKDISHWSVVMERTLHEITGQREAMEGSGREKYDRNILSRLCLAQHLA